LSRPRLPLRTPATIGAHPRRDSGQGLVEFAMLVPVFLLILLGMLEFGFAFNHNLTLETATREGARAGAAMADGSQTDVTCGVGGKLTDANVDPLIIAAVQRVLNSPGSMIDKSNVTSITIYEVTYGGVVTGLRNVWNQKTGAGTSIPCVSSSTLDYSPDLTKQTWPTATRTLGATPDSIGVSITYTYQFRSALGGILRFVGGSSWSQITMTDSTVMALQPTG
jgi:hypothetical protein